MYVYNRSLNVNVQSGQGEMVLINGVFLDTFHEMCLTLEINLNTLTVIKASGQLKRLPHQDCADVENRIPLLTGLTLRKGVRKQIKQAVGGREGCTHLADLALQCIESLVQARYSIMKEIMTQEEIFTANEQFLQGTCYHFRHR